MPRDNSVKNVAAKKRFSLKSTQRYFREFKSEIKKIIWPTRQQVLNNTAIVLAAILVIGAFVWIFDALLGLGVTTILSRAY